MARIAGVNIPSNKRVEISLRYIYGIGPARAKEICKQLDIAPTLRVHQLTDTMIIRIRETIDNTYQVEGDLRREVMMNIKRLMISAERRSSADIKWLMDLGCYRGLRHRRGLPVRGQRTHSNACRSKAKTGKKK